MKEQIEEMAKLACSCFDGNCKGCPFDFYPPCPPKASAKRLYNAGYRKQKEGEWEMQEYPVTQCTVCGMRRNIETQDAWNFCPNCGAHMKGAENE